MATINSKTYTLDEMLGGLAIYVGANHSFTNRDEVALSRVKPKPGRNGDKGVARPSARFTRTVVVNPTTGETKDLILTITGSEPVGVSDADIDSICSDAGAFLSSADGKLLFKKLDMNI